MVPVASVSVKVWEVAEPPMAKVVVPVVPRAGMGGKVKDWPTTAAAVVAFAGTDRSFVTTGCAGAPPPPPPQPTSAAADTAAKRAKAHQVRVIFTIRPFRKLLI